MYIEWQISVRYRVISSRSISAIELSGLGVVRLRGLTSNVWVNLPITSLSTCNEMTNLVCNFHILLYLRNICRSMNRRIHETYAAQGICDIMGTPVCGVNVRRAPEEDTFPTQWRSEQWVSDDYTSTASQRPAANTCIIFLISSNSRLKVTNWISQGWERVAHWLAYRFLSQLSDTSHYSPSQTLCKAHTLPFLDWWWVVSCHPGI